MIITLEDGIPERIEIHTPRGIVVLENYPGSFVNITAQPNIANGVRFNRTTSGAGVLSLYSPLQPAAVQTQIKSQ
jgi:hypothetical protein